VWCINVSVDNNTAQDAAAGILTAESSRRWTWENVQNLHQLSEVLGNWKCL